MIKKYDLTITSELAGLRIDSAVVKTLSNEITRSNLKNNLLTFTVNGKNEKFSYKCKENDKVYFEININDFENIAAEKIPLDIVFEDENYILINKKYNMVVHPAKSNFTGTLVNALLGMNKELYNNDDKMRLGIVHRLDKETSGLIITAKNKDSFDYLSLLFRKREIEKKYHAITSGYFTPTPIIIENNIGRHPVNRKKMAVVGELSGKKSITVVENALHFKNYSYLDINLKTGRTHQIRVHLSSMGFPVVGDLIYSRKNKDSLELPLCLSSYYLSFFDKFSGKILQFSIDDPGHMRKLLRNLSNSI